MAHWKNERVFNMQCAVRLASALSTLPREVDKICQVPMLLTRKALKQATPTFNHIILFKRDIPGGIWGKDTRERFLSLQVNSLPLIMPLIYTHLQMDDRR